MPFRSLIAADEAQRRFEHLRVAPHACPPPRAQGVGEHPIVACYRGLDTGDAVRLGALLAGALDQPFVLASAARREPAVVGARAVSVLDDNRCGGAAQAALRRARALAGTDIDVREQTVPSVGVAEALIDLARDVDACALVLGRDTQGYVTRWLLPRAPCPVAVAPLSVPLAQVGPFERIGIAYDGSPTARWALLAATRLARAAGARLVLLTAGPTAELAGAWLHVARMALDPGFESCEARALIGEAPATLTRASADLDLLVCGSRGRGRPHATILGSVSAHLVEQARCPLLVVPRAVWQSDSGPLGITSAAAPV